MFRLAKLEVLPSWFIDLKYDVPLCAPYIFVTARRRQWVTKGKKSGSIKKDTDKNTGYGVSEDQLQSDQPG